jgi:L-amino acid N-acyltransferase YncA
MLALRSATPNDAPALLNIYAPYVCDSPVSFETEVPSIAMNNDNRCEHSGWLGDSCADTWAP